MLDRGEDRGLVLDDPFLEGDERGDPAAAGPADPGFEGVDGLVVAELEYQPEAFLEQVGPVQPGVGLGDPGELGLLPGGEVLRVLPQCVPGALELLGMPAGTPGATLVDRATGLVPRLPADLVQGVGGPADDVERVMPTSA